MHRILLREVVIDVPADSAAATRQFWAEALAARPATNPTYPEFTALADAAATLEVGIQTIGSSSPGVHLDIESDDVPAEAARLVRLGAVEVARRGTWIVLRDPAGLLFCVVPADSPDFAERSREVD